MAPLAEHLSLIPRKTSTSLGGITAIGGGSGDDGSALSIAARVGIALGVMAGVAAIGAAFYVWLVRKRRRRVAPMKTSKKMERDSSVEEPRAPPGVHVRPGFDAAKGMR